MQLARKLPIGLNVFVALSNREVSKRNRIAPCALEVSVLRLRWMQQLLKGPSKHVQFLDAVFGGMSFDEPIGRHECLGMLANDLDLLADMDEGHSLRPQLHAHPELLLTDLGVRSAFVALGVGALRERYFSVTAPPQAEVSAKQATRVSQREFQYRLV